ncbi:MAG: hypothetical protein H7Y00_10545 [Fimbriimonadaceae bacterium]|nr:hypothetical protein [Chitinophagales bacterium]
MAFLYMNFNQNIYGDIIKLRISSNSTIRDVQNDLEQQFPFLKFEFCKNMESESKNERPEMLSPALKLSAFVNGRENIYINLNEDKKVFELKNDFKNIGLAIVIYRISGNVWVKTSLTEDWSLQMQNTAGKNFSA